jgi:ribosomal protein S18 acetylase RimI-like enzyme
MARRGLSIDVEIRLYTGSDRDAVISVMRDLAVSELETYDRTRQPEDWGAHDIEEFQREIEKSKGTMLVAELDGAVVGFCNLHTHRNTEDDQDEVYYQYSYIGDLSVLMQYRSLGIGARLIKHCEEIVRAAGVKWLRLNVSATNTRGRKFYAEHGFEERLILLEKSL